MTEEQIEQQYIYSGVEPKAPKSMTTVVRDMWITKWRQSGRTTDVIYALPDDGVAILAVHNPHMRRYMRDKIIELRGKDYPVKKLHIIVVQNPSDIYKETLGLSRMPIYIDNAVIDMWLIEMVSNIERIG